MAASSLHYVVFDGTSAFVCSFEDIDEECEVLAKFYDLNLADKFCEKENDKIMDWV